MHAQGMSGQSFRAHKPNKRRRDCWHADAACNMQHHTSLVSVGTMPPDNSDDTLNCVVSLWWSSDRHNDYQPRQHCVACIRTRCLGAHRCIKMQLEGTAHLRPEPHARTLDQRQVSTCQKAFHSSRLSLLSLASCTRKLPSSQQTAGSFATRCSCLDPHHTCSYIMTHMCYMRVAQSYKAS